MTARTLMVFGTASDAGKSTIVAALCRAFAQQGVSVAPFKAQNMARNAYVCSDGGEIGVAQAVQALAARVTPCIDHNPILLKPEPELRSQLIVHGRSLGSRSFTDLTSLRPQLVEALRSSLGRLRARHQLVILEGAGSPAEVNLATQDLPNLEAARAANADIILVADIDRGGVFASIVGTLELLPTDLRPRVKGFIVNKLRGDVGLLDSGLTFLTQRTGVPSLGVVPFFTDLGLPDEDSLALDRHRRRARAGLTDIEIAVVDAPCLANFEDVLALEQERGVTIRLTRVARELLEADLVILAGSKNTAFDLDWLRTQHIDLALLRRAKHGDPILGICGGAQMLGDRIEDPDGVESAQRSMQALGLLPHDTLYAQPKVTRRVSGCFSALDSQARIEGFFLHHGRLVRAKDAQSDSAAILDDGTLEGSVRGAVIGTMIHRVFDHVSARKALLAYVCRARGLPTPVHTASRPDPYDALASHVRNALDWPRLSAIALGETCDAIR